MPQIIRISIKKVTLKSQDPFANFCNIMGVADIDKNKIVMQILELLYKYDGLNSTELSRLTGKSRGAILNHLENLIDAGFIFKYGKQYYLRDRNFSHILKLIERDISRTLDMLRHYAQDIDEKLKE